MKARLATTLFAGACALAQAAPVTYTIDPAHTYPSFEADHMGISVWRGKFTHNSGTVVLDRAAQQGSIDVTIDASSIDFGLPRLNTWAQGTDLFSVAKFGKEAHYVGKLAGFVNGLPTEVDGTLSLHGVTRPVRLKIAQFRCVPHPMFKRELCGADAYGSFDRAQFGLDAGKDYGFNMNVALRIQAEAIANQ